MRGLLIFVAVVVYLFSLVFIESELVKLQARKESLENRFTELKNQRKILEFEVMKLSNLAEIEAKAKERDFIFPRDEDILGIIK